MDCIPFAQYIKNKGYDKNDTLIILYYAQCAHVILYDKKLFIQKITKSSRGPLIVDVDVSWNKLDNVIYNVCYINAEYLDNILQCISCFGDNLSGSINESTPYILTNINKTIKNLRSFPSTTVEKEFLLQLKTVIESKREAQMLIYQKALDSLPDHLFNDDAPTD